MKRILIVAACSLILSPGRVVADDAWSRGAVESLVARWCDALMARQISGMPDRMLDGGIVCPACGVLHGRICDLVYPFAYRWAQTGDRKFLDAAEKAVGWAENAMRREDGGVYNDYQSLWWPTTTFAQIALGKTLLFYGDRLPGALRERWRTIFRRETEFLDSRFDGEFLDRINVNYPAAFCEAMALAGRVLEDAGKTARARRMADRLRAQFMPDGLVTGEGASMSRRSPRDLAYVDFGYNLEETLPALLAYAELCGDGQMKSAVLASAAVHAEFLLPDGGLDNSCGSRNPKWTYYGSRTSDGMLPLLGALAKSGTPWAVRAIDRQVKLYERCTTSSGLLAGGVCYEAASEPPCVHHAFAHVKSLVDLLRDSSVPLSAPAAEMPREKRYGLRSFDSIGAHLCAVGPWRATLSGGDAFKRGKPGQRVTGGGPSLVWHEAAGPVLLGTMADYDIVEPRNLQDLRHERAVLSMMPRIESEGYSSARECNAEMSVDAVPGGVACVARGRLTNIGDERSAAYILKSRLDEASFTLSGSCETNAFFVLPVVAMAADGVDVEGGRVRIRRGGCDVAVESDLAFELVRTERGDRAFSPVAGFLYAYLKAPLAAGREFSVRLSVATQEGSQNLIVNPDLSQFDEVGTIRGWKHHLKKRLVTSIDVQSKGDGAFRVSAKGEVYAILQQTGIGLVPGGRYRLSYELRTEGDKGGRPQFFLHDGNWKWGEEQDGPKAPGSTNGQWLPLEKTVVAQDGAGGIGHTLSVHCLQSDGPKEVSFEIRNLRLEAVDAETAAKSRPKECRALKARIVPVDPLLTAVDPESAFLTFFWPGVPECGRTNCCVAAHIDDMPYSQALLDARGYATVTFGRIEKGVHRLRVGVKDPGGKWLATDEYSIEARPRIPEKSVGRKLNNFVRELVNRPLENGEVEFTCAKDGWVWIYFGKVSDGADADSLCGFLDGASAPVVLRREGELYLETQRWLAAGRHRLRVDGAKPGRTLKIHAVKTIWGNAPKDLSSAPCDFSQVFSYTLPFARRFSLISTLNTIGKAGRYLDGSDNAGAEFFRERGIALVGTDKLSPTNKTRNDLEELTAFLKSGSWRMGHTVVVDENFPNPETAQGVNFSEAVWRLFGEDNAHRVNVFYCGDTATGGYFKNPEVNVSEIAAVVNTGMGSGLLCPECYAPVGKDRASLDQYIDGYANFVQSSERMVPAAKGATLIYGSGYIDLFDYSPYICPESDIKAQYSELIRAVATDPRFEGCAGIGFGGGACCEEEFRRWGTKVTRHYALEGATDDLAARYGYKWTPGFVKNADFQDGEANWTFRPAAGGSIVAESIKKYGKQYQARIGVPDGYGDTVATFKTSPEGANEVRQEISGLEPGRYYALHFAVADKGTLKACAGDPPVVPRFFSARLEGAERIAELCYEHLRRGRMAPGAAKNKASLRSYRFVFKAKQPAATLVLADCAPDGRLNEPGVELSLNYIIFRPYYVENEGEVAEIVSALGWKGEGLR